MGTAEDLNKQITELEEDYQVIRDAMQHLESDLKHERERALQIEIEKEDLQKYLDNRKETAEILESENQEQYNEIIRLR